jgi:hypothetical protein
MLEGSIIQPDQAQAPFEIADGVVMGIGDEREQMALRTRDRDRWALGRAALADNDANLHHGIRVKLSQKPAPDTAATIVSAPALSVPTPDMDPLLCKMPLPYRGVFYPLGFAVEVRS